MENSKDKLQLTVRREVVAGPVSAGPGRSTPLSGVGLGPAGSHLPRPADLTHPYDPSGGGPGGGAGPGPGVPPPPPGNISISSILFHIDIIQ